MLNTVHYGETKARPLIVAHGLFGSARNWSVLSKRLSDQRPVIAVDMRNHGASPWFDRHDYFAMSEDLAEVIKASGGIADVLGHSMGGKAAMVLALRRPELLGKLVVADIAPISNATSQVHLIDAMQAVNLAAVQSRRDADVQMSEAVKDSAVRAFLLQSLDLKSDPKAWKLNLSVLKATMNNSIGFPDVQGRFAGPALFVTGGASDYVKAAHHAVIKGFFPNVDITPIPGAGHWLHAEKPRELESMVRDFLNQPHV